MVLRGKPVGEQGAADRWTAFRSGRPPRETAGASSRLGARRPRQRFGFQRGGYFNQLGHFNLIFGRGNLIFGRGMTSSVLTGVVE